MHDWNHWWIGFLAFSICARSPMAQAADTDTDVVYGARTELAQRKGPYPWNYEGSLPRTPRPAFVAGACPSTVPMPRVLIAGDSLASRVRRNIVLFGQGQSFFECLCRRLPSKRFARSAVEGGRNRIQFVLGVCRPQLVMSPSNQIEVSPFWLGRTWLGSLGCQIEK